MRQRLLNIATMAAAVLGMLLIVLALYTSAAPFTLRYSTASKTTYFFDSRYGHIRLVRQAVTPRQSGTLMPDTDVLDVQGATDGTRRMGRFSYKPPAPFGFQFARHRVGWFIPGGSIGAVSIPTARDIFTFDYLSIGCPYWFPIVILLAWVVIRSRSRMNIARRRALGLCIRCGYDLRALPDRCPECGTVAGAVNTAG